MFRDKCKNHFQNQLITKFINNTYERSFLTFLTHSAHLTLILLLNINNLFAQNLLFI